MWDLSTPNLRLWIPGLNRSLQQLLLPLISLPYIAFSVQLSPKPGPHLPSRLIRLGFYWSGSPTSAFIKDMRGPGGWGGLFAVRREERAAHSHGIVFNRTQLSSTQGSAFPWNTFGKRLHLCLACSFENIWGLSIAPPQKNQSQQTRLAEWKALVFLMSKQRQKLYADDDFTSTKCPNASERLLFTFQPLQNRLSDSRIY